MCLIWENDKFCSKFHLNRQMFSRWNKKLLSGQLLRNLCAKDHFGRKIESWNEDIVIEGTAHDEEPLLNEHIHAQF